MEITREFLSTVFIVHKNKVLLNWNEKCNIWVPLGGHIEKNELPCDSVIREAKEESGLDIELFNPYSIFKEQNLAQPIAIRLDHIKDDHKHINLTYFARVKGGIFTEVSDEGWKNRWFSMEELENEPVEKLVPNVRELALEALESTNKK